MSGLHKVVVLSIAATLAYTGAALAQKLPVHPPGAGALQMAPTTGAQKYVAVTHGTWMQGPGTYAVTVCASGCIITGAPGTTINLAIEAWGAGGGGGGGQEALTGPNGTSGGGGGGGGGYTPGWTAVIVPASGTTTTYQVVVGIGGTPGYSGGSGGVSEVRRVGGQIVVGATGGARGGVGTVFGGNGGAGGINSAGGQGNTVSHSGSVGASVTTCNGGGGGAGGAGSGPGAINNGGNGGHGGYYNKLLDGCTSKGSMFGLSAGSAGANGRVKIVW